MAEYGTILARAFTSEAQIPIPGAAVTISQQRADGEALLAMRLSNFDGVTQPVPLSAPDAALSRRYGAGEAPFTRVNVAVEAEFYDRIEVQDVQIFAGTQTVQNLQLIPTPTLRQSSPQRQLFRVTPQPL